MIEKIIYIALASSFVLMLLVKTGALDYYAATRRSWMPAGDCFFCFGWWLSCLGAFILFMWELNFCDLLIPFFSAVIVNFVMINSTK